jgi:DNA-binding MarR family transcriptional regulator
MLRIVARVDTNAAMHVAAFRAALRSFLRESELVARSSGLTPQRYLLLLMIKGAPNGSECATISELVDRLGVAQSTVTELVNRAEEAGLIEREPSDTDGRVAHVRLTQEGEDKLALSFSRLDVERERLRRAFDALEEE